MTEVRSGRDGRDGATGAQGIQGEQGVESTEIVGQFARMQVQLENITASLCDLKPLTVQIANLVVVVNNMVAQVKGHDVTLYGEKSESGLVGRLEQLSRQQHDDIAHVTDRLNQIMAVGGVVGTTIIAWLMAQWLGLIKP